MGLQIANRWLLGYDGPGRYKKRNVLIAAFSLVAFAGSAEAAPKHTWFALNYRTATCDNSSQTPEEFFSYLNGPFGHMAGIIPQTIAPSDVTKFGDDSLKVTIRASKNGADGFGYDFFSMKEMCEIYAKGVKPDQAPAADIN